MAIPGYTIESIRTSTQVDARGNLVDYLEVYFTTSDGDSSFLRVPKAFTASEIKQALKDEADKLLALRQ
jgi:hypothetical protein